MAPFAPSQLWSITRGIKLHVGGNRSVRVHRVRGPGNRWRPWHGVWRHCDDDAVGLGVAPPIAIASVHTAEVFTTGVSGAAHLAAGNVDVALARRLAFADVAGGGTGAYLSTALPGSVIRPFISLYLLAIGIVIVWRAIGRFGNDRSTAASISSRHA